MRALAHTALLATFCGLAPMLAHAQSVSLAGVSEGKALLVVDGGAPRFASPGQTVHGVKLLSVGADQAVVEQEGKRQTLRLGESPLPATQNPLSNDRRIVLMADNGGHFSTGGQINGKAVQFLVDTGATVMTLSEAEAKRIGLNYSAGQAIRVRTANGDIVGHQVQLNQVRLGGHVSYNVAAVVLAAQVPYVLLGNSFLARFNMRRENDRMILEPRY